MNFSKAFDTLPHALLISKLEAYNVSDQTCKMVKWYLIMRNRRIKMGMHRSGWKWLEKGVPQVSINGSDYLIIFPTDLFYCLDGLCNIDNHANNNTLSEEILKSQLCTFNINDVVWQVWPY